MTPREEPRLLTKLSPPTAVTTELAETWAVEEELEELATATDTETAPPELIVKVRSVEATPGNAARSAVRISASERVASRRRRSSLAPGMLSEKRTNE